MRARGLWNKMRRRIMVAIMAFTLAIVSYPVSVHATSDTKDKLDEAEAEKEEKEAELAAAQQELANTQADLASLEGVKDTYQGQMSVLNDNLQLVADNLAVLESQIELKQIEILETQYALEQAQITREEQYESMKARIQFLYERGETAYIDILFSAESFGEFLNYADYIEQLSAYDREMLNEYIATEQEITVQEANLEQEMDDLQAMKDETVAQQEQVTGMINNTAANIAATADSIDAVEAEADAYEQECDERAAAAAAANAEYEAIKAQYEEEMRMSQLASESDWRDVSQVTFEEGDRYLLANLIYCEAGGESYEGKLAVGAVVVNRVLSSVYPGTVTGVIYQNRQFSPVANGHLALALAENRATESCYQAADAALSGSTNVGSCVYFRTPLEGLTGISIGGHIFY